jgi:Fe-S oxidoreductase
MSDSKIVPDSANIDSCIGCGGCIGRCFLLEAMPGMNPRRLVRLSLLGEEHQIRDSEFLWACTLCIRCTEDCPAGVRMDQVTRSLRSRMTADGLAPADLVAGIEVSLEMGNNSRISKEDFKDTIEWLSEELQSETGDETATIPIDVAGSKVLFIPNPREILYLPMLLTATAQVLRAASESWTVSSNTYDITNWAYYTGDQANSQTITRRIIDEAHRLEVEVILSTECGHGFKILREDAKQWFGSHHRFEVMSLAETFAGYLDEGRITLDPGKQTQRVTYHDPCNLARKVGVIEQPRRVLRAAVEHFVDMEPSGRLNWCCGGGGGVGQIGRQTATRLKAGARKAEQIRRTEADILVTSCQNCFSQLTDLKKEYGLGVEIKTLAQIVAGSLVDRG